MTEALFAYNNRKLTADQLDIAWWAAEEENKRITSWLLDNNIIRGSMLGQGYVAVKVDGETVAEFTKVGD